MAKQRKGWPHWLNHGGSKPWHACRIWHASTSIQHLSEASETRSSPFKVSVSSFSFVNNPLFNFTLMCFWCHMAKNRAVSTAVHTPQLGGTLPQGPKIQTPHHKFWLARGRICHWFRRFGTQTEKLPAPGLDYQILLHYKTVAQAQKQQLLA